MRKVWLIARLDLLVFLRSRGNLLQLLLLPVLLTLVLGYALGGVGAPQRVRLDVLDEDGSAQAAQLLAALEAQGPALQICPAPDADCDWPDEAPLSLSVAQERLRQDTADALLHIPPGLGAALAARQQAALPFYTRASVLATDPAWQALQVALQRVNGAVAAGVTGAALHGALELDAATRAAMAQAASERAAQAWAARTAIVEATFIGAPAPDAQAPGGFTQSVPGMATFYVLFSVMGGGVAVLMRERRQGTLARMATLPLRRSEIIGGKILARFLTGILQFLIVFAVGVVIGLDFGRSPLALILLMASYTLAVTALGLVLAGHLQNEEQAFLLTSLLAMVMAALGGAWWSLSLAPQFMQVLGHLTPVAWAMDGFQQLIVYGGGLQDVLLPLAVLSGSTVVLFALGLRLFRFR